MTEQSTTDVLLATQAKPGQPDVLFALVAQICADQFGFRFLTVLKTMGDARHLRRVYSSSPDDYPTGALKPMGGTDWGALVLGKGQSWLGVGRDQILWAFPDAQRILAKGCEACACAPVIWNGQTLGVLSLNAERNRYSPADLKPMQKIAQTLIPALILPDDRPTTAVNE